MRRPRTCVTGHARSDAHLRGMSERIRAWTTTGGDRHGRDRGDEGPGDRVPGPAAPARRTSTGAGGHIGTPAGWGFVADGVPSRTSGSQNSGFRAGDRAPEALSGLHGSAFSPPGSTRTVGGAK